MFDLTREIQLEPVWQKRYFYARLFLYLVFILGALFLADRILFPSQTFTLDAANRGATSSTSLYNSGTGQDYSLLSAYSSENFSNATIRIVSDKGAASLAGQTVSVRKTYQAFTYPVSPQPASLPVADANSSSFADGTLLSFDNAVFVVVDGKVRPFNNPITFLSFGYNWSDVVPVSEDKIGLYQRAKLFTIDLPHPDGTVFLTRDSGQYFLVQAGQKLQITDPEILKSYATNAPIPVDEKSLDFNLSCVLKKDLWPLNSYSCTVPVAKLGQFLGNDYQFRIGGTEKYLSQASVTFLRALNWSNARDVLSVIKQKFLNNYGYQTQ